MTDRRRFASDAEYYRHHRQVFLLALELGCTPIAAEAEMRAIEQHERRRAAEDRRACLTSTPMTRPVDAWGASWMMRD